MGRGQRTIAFSIVAIHAERSPRARPLGAACVLAAAKRHPGLEFANSTLVEAVVGDDLGGLSTRVAESLAGQGQGTVAAVGLSCYAWNADAMIALRAALRGSSPDAFVLAGGPLASADPGWALGALGADAVVSGEGESAIGPLLERLALGDRPKGVVASEPARLGAYPSPWLSGLVDPSRGVAWELARGCPYKCGYCFESRGERRVRALDEARFEAELESFAKARPRYVYVLDPTFNAVPERAPRLVARLRRVMPEARFEFELRAELVDAALAKELGRTDCGVQLGLQSVRQEVVAASGRAGFDRAKFKRGVSLLASRGVTFGLDVIYGLPEDTLEGFAQTLDFALDLEPNHVDVFRLSILPGTDFRDREAELGFIRDEGPPWLVRGTPTFPAKDLDQAERLANACDWFYSRGRALGWWKAVLAPTRLRPRGLLEFAADAGDPREPGSTPAEEACAIEAAQLAVVTQVYRARSLESYLPEAKDLIRFNAAWCAAMAEGERRELLVTHHPGDLDSPVARDLRALASARLSRPIAIAIAPGDGLPTIEIG